MYAVSKQIAAVPKKIIASAKSKSAFDSVEFHKQTGRYASTFANGVPESFALNEIRINKSAPNYFKIYSEDEMKEMINKAFTYTESAIRLMINKMYHANSEEKAVFVRIYEECLNAELTDEIIEKLKILEYTISEAEIFDR